MRQREREKGTLLEEVGGNTEVESTTSTSRRSLQSRANQIRTPCDNRICYISPSSQGSTCNRSTCTQHMRGSRHKRSQRKAKGERERTATHPPPSRFFCVAPHRTFFFHSSAALAGGKKTGVGRPEDVKQTSWDQEGRENDVGGDGGRAAGAANLVHEGECSVSATAISLLWGRRHWAGLRRQSMPPDGPTTFHPSCVST